MLNMRLQKVNTYAAQLNALVHVAIVAYWLQSDIV